MVKHPPTTMVRVIVAFALTAVVALLPMTVLLVFQHGVPGEAVLVLTGVSVVTLSAAAVATVVVGAQRRLRPAHG